MSNAASLLAEQSIFAQLIVKKIKSEPSKFQLATLGKNSIYSYYSGARLTTVDPKDYSIINLPDTIEFLPKNSIFDNILLIRSSSPDYRFVPIASPTVQNESMKRAIIANDADIKVKKFKTPRRTETIFSNEYSISAPPVEDDDSYGDNDDSVAAAPSSSNQQQQAQAVPAPAAPPPQNNGLKFTYRDFNNVSTYSNFNSSVMANVVPIVVGFANDDEQESTWIQALQSLYNFDSNIALDQSRNPTTAAWRIILYMANSVGASNKYDMDGINNIKAIIDNYTG
ncbi:OrNV gp028-like protein [Tomelloso virus]|uniref:OrNV gp028-like protein n=1 Tax=Tomelloso virus TaxID=2053981 RepID=A0A2H4T2S0_9VIRU|nr:OrNV gp028-like protein [Tomelloso virus]ATY70224.1 OrNV gp028-like protein [Tomelloso virus]